MTNVTRNSNRRAAKNNEETITTSDTTGPLCVGALPRRDLPQRDLPWRTSDTTGPLRVGAPLPCERSERSRDRGRGLGRPPACLLLASALLTILLTGCHPDKPPVAVIAAVKATTPSVTFTDATKAAGIDFRHVSGATKSRLLPETMGSGLAWIDYDGDGFPDLFLVNSRPWTQAECIAAKIPYMASTGPMPTCKLFHNNGNGTFTDVTKQAHLDVAMYGMGVCVGDYDNSGHPSLYVTGMGRNYLFRNNGDGTFKEVTEQAGLKDSGWSTSAAWVDYDKDGKLDLVVCHYVQWSPATDIAFMKNGHRTYGTPNQYSGQPLTLYHNDGAGHFTEVAEKAGLRTGPAPEKRKLQGKSLGVAICDYDGDGWPDIAIANDTEPNYLFHNEHDGTFKEAGVEQGMAYNDSGAARGAMGIAACDYDHTGRESLIIGNFSNQMIALYHNQGSIFRDTAAQSGVGPPSLLSLSFGLFFCDLDNDGWQDIFVANGHIDDDVQEDQKEVTYAESPLVYRNLGNGSFTSVGDKLGVVMQAKYVARGCAYADYLLNGFPDIALSTSNGPAYLFRNSADNGNHALRLELEGTQSNRSAIGAVVTVKAGAQTLTYNVRSGSSYCSQSELPITVGLGSAAKADSVTIVWPSGGQQVLNSLAAGQIYHILESSKGMPLQRPFGQPYKPAAQVGRLLQAPGTLR